MWPGGELSVALARHWVTVVESLGFFPSLAVLCSCYSFLGISSYRDIKSK